jgi:hypothetical protein
VKSRRDLAKNVLGKSVFQQVAYLWRTLPQRSGITEMGT